MPFFLLYFNFFDSDLVLLYLHYVVLFIALFRMKKHKLIFTLNSWFFALHAFVLWYGLISNSSGGQGLVWWFYEMFCVWIQLAIILIFWVYQSNKKKKP